MRWLFAAVACVAVPAALAPTGAQAHSGSGCRLAGPYKHVIYLQFDNVHLRRDNPNVPSDLEQMPHLLNFLQGNGTVLNKHYTVLISHTAGGITSSLTGLYPDRMGPTVTNSYDYYDPQTGIPTYTSAFKYWTAPVAAGVDNKPNMVNGDSGKPLNTPAPWVTYTRAGCDVGNVSVANTVLENANAAKFQGLSDLYSAAKAGDTSVDPYSKSGFSPGEQITIDTGANQETATIQSLGKYTLNLTAPLKYNHAAGVEVWGPYTADPTGDLTAAFGANTAPWQEGFASQTAPYGSAAANKATTDFVGIAVHCAKTGSSVCANNSGAYPDLLPDEPGGYNGYKALFGAKFVDPAITGGAAAVKDVYNTNDITDSFGQPGFPGFDAMPASTTLGYVAQMQERGVPVTLGYISDAHDNHSGGEGAFGPGETGYVAQLKSYDKAFAAFFDRLAKDHINKSNTLFVVTTDESDNFAGGQAQGCDGVNTPCHYTHGQYDLTQGGHSKTGPSSWPPAGVSPTSPLIGEVGYNMDWLLGSTIGGTGYDISFDSAPSFYINGQPEAVDSSGNVVLNPTLRAFEGAAANLQAFNPYVNANGVSPVARYLVDGPTLKALHMINADPQRTMSFTMFSQPSYYFQTYSPCAYPSQGCTNDAYAWIHGDYANQIGQNWLGIVGPGVRAAGLNNTTWTDHTDIVPTMNALLGLHPDYTPDGRVITQVLAPWARGDARGSSALLGSLYKQLDAPYGAFDHWLVAASTNGIKGDDSTYLSTEKAIQQLTTARDALVAQMRAQLNRDGRYEGRASDGYGGRESSQKLFRRGYALLVHAAELAGSF